jgi:Plasmid pRiA4b ORF-3-like protein
VEEIIDDFDKNHPVCLDGEGNTPPEDVGGTAGYEEFLRILADERHPDHKEMKSWGKANGYEEFKIDFINIRLN